MIIVNCYCDLVIVNSLVWQAAGSLGGSLPRFRWGPGSYVSQHMFVYVYMCMYVCIYIYIYMYMYMSIYLYLSLYTYIYICIFIHMYVCMCFLFISLSLSYICIHMYMYIYIYIIASPASADLVYEAWNPRRRRESRRDFASRDPSVDFLTPSFHDTNSANPDTDNGID